MEEGDVAKPVEVKTEAAKVDDHDDEPQEKGYSVDDAIKLTLRKALFTNTLYRGLREACRVLDARQGLICFLAESCDHADYKKLVEALCAEHKTFLVKVKEGQQLGEWSGLCTYDKEGQAHKVVGASCVVVHQNIAKENDPAVNWLLQHLKTEAK